MQQTAYSVLAYSGSWHASYWQHSRPLVSRSQCKVTSLGSLLVDEEGMCYSEGWLIELWFYAPLDTEQVILETFPKPISWLGMEKQNLTQQKHAFTNQNKCTTTQTQQN